MGEAPDDVAVQALDRLAGRRRSVRGFRPDPVPPDHLTRAFAIAQQAPSWCNVQPWRVVVTSPPATDRVRTALLAAATTSAPHPDVPFPFDYPPPYQGHRRDCGVALYQAMGVARDDKAGRYQAWLRNFALFDAPHLAVVSCDRRLGPYAFVDVGVWLGAFFAAATALGVDSCAMASVATYPTVLRRELAIPNDEIILFGIALGYEDPTVLANACRTTRAPVEANVRVLDV